ncbi:MAG: protein kinase [Planctomycetes bacterium]|nr:protein kinase [Planctomycetota bacterium]MBI3762842.1 protein kinase [Chloroflexota bacterium]
MTPPTLTPEAADELAARLIDEMIQRWQNGERPVAEEFLERHPQLWAFPEAAAELIYEELCLRREHGLETPTEEVLRRFPQWRAHLEILCDFHRLLGSPRTEPRFPETGESLGDFVLLFELGRGAHARVFLANQLSLGDRPVVLKLIPMDAHEHLSLARLQHTHILPIHSVQDHPALGLRALCMPYFGGATLAQLLELMHAKPPARRAGHDLLEAIDSFKTPTPSGTTAADPARQAFAGSSYVQAVCWIGACLADALQYAHERGLVHLDIKPSNILLAADAQPMLLDFHLARAPIEPDGNETHWLGGTGGYMSPEQQSALQNVARGRKVLRPVDARSDIYSLGVVLHEALAGSLRLAGMKPRSLHHCNSQVSAGLADIVARCLADDPAKRYPHMTALAADLRRHLADLPLRGVRNRNLAERWRKWRRRRPHGLARVGIMLALLVSAGAVCLGALHHYNQRVEQAHSALRDGQMLMVKGEWHGAIGRLERGRRMAQGLLLQHELAGEFDSRLHLAEQGLAIHSLHEIAERFRFLYGMEHVSPERLRGLESCCRALWERRDRIVERLSCRHRQGLVECALDPKIHDDLLDLAILWADLQVRLTSATEKGKAHEKALKVLAEAEALFGPSAVLDEERELHGGPPNSGSPVKPQDSTEESAWKHYALARSLLRAGNLQRAAEEASAAVRIQPQALWPNFYHGLCAYRLRRYEEAATAFSICIGAAPEAASCFHHRALALAALGRSEQAQLDYDWTVRLDPTIVVPRRNFRLIPVYTHLYKK